MKKLIFLILTAQTGVCCAQSGTDTVSKNIELSEAVIRQSRVSIHDEQMLKKIQPSFIKRMNQAQDLPYLLNSIAGVVVSSDAGTGTGYTDIKVRGTDLTRINVTMNGIPVNDPESQATYFVNTPDLLSSANEVELQKGVGSSKNGNASFGASIAINNLDVKKEKAFVQYRVDAGRFSTFRNTLKLGTGLIHNRFSVTGRVSDIRSAGYIQRSSSLLKGSQLSALYKISKSSQLVFNYVQGHEKTGQAWNGVPQDSLTTHRTYNELGLKADGSFYKNQTDNYGQHYYQLFFDSKISRKIQLGSAFFYTQGKGYYEEYKRSQVYADYGLPNFVLPGDTITSTDLIRQLWLDNDFYGGRVFATYLSNKLDLGLYVNYNQYQGRHHGDIIWAQQGIDKDYRWYQLHARKSDFNVYGMGEYRLNEHFSMLLDAQIRQVNYQLFGFRNNPNLNHDLSYLFFNPKLRLQYHHGKHSLTYVNGLSNKEPNRDDIEAGVQSLPKQEKLWDQELTYHYRVHSSFSLFTTLYYMKYHNQLVLTGKLNDVGAYTRTNIPDSYRRGIEIEALWKPSQQILECRMNVALSENKIKSFTEYLDNYDWGGQDTKTYSLTNISFSPSVVAGGSLSFFPLRNRKNSWYKDLSLDILPKYISRQFLDNTSNTNRMLKAYCVTDMIVQLPFHSRKSEELITLRCGIYNVLNTLYEARGYTFSYIDGQQLQTFNYYYPQSGTRYMVGVGIDL